MRDNNGFFVVSLGQHLFGGVWVVKEVARGVRQRVFLAGCVASAKGISLSEPQFLRLSSGTRRTGRVDLTLFLCPSGSCLFNTGGGAKAMGGREAGQSWLQLGWWATGCGQVGLGILRKKVRVSGT